jgi:hypothetical protein
MTPELRAELIKAAKMVRQAKRSAVLQSSNYAVDALEAIAKVFEMAHHLMDLGVATNRRSDEN